MKMGWEVRRYTSENFRFATTWAGFERNKCVQIRGGATGLHSTRQSCDLG